MYKGLLKHMYLLLTLRHPGTGLNLQSQSALYSVFGAYLFTRFMYGVVTNEKILQTLLSLVVVSVICYLLQRMTSRSIFTSYCLCMITILPLSALTNIIFGSEYEFVWVIWSLIMLVKIAITLSKNEELNK